LKGGYLSGRIHVQSDCYVLAYKDTPVAFAAVIPNAGHKGRYRIHRVVVLPDYQGVGFGKALLNFVGSV